jgi:hypothetical protein
MVHRDIKPQNLMLTDEGRIKILDFGLARLASEMSAGASGALTQRGMVMGTPDYIAPEQANDAHAADIRADIYSLGCTLYHLLAGQPPFPSGTVLEKVLSHLERQPQPITSLRGDVPAALVEVLARMTAKAPAQRYQTPAEVVQALQPFVTGTAPAVPPTVTPIPDVVRVRPAPPPPRRPDRWTEDEYRPRRRPENRPGAGLAMVSLVLGLVALGFAWVPCLGLLSLPVSAIGLLLGIAAFFFAFGSRPRKLGLPLGGAVVNLAAIAVAVLVMYWLNWLFQPRQQPSSPSVFVPPVVNQGPNFQPTTKGTEVKQPDKSGPPIKPKTEISLGEISIRVNSATVDTIQLPAGSRKVLLLALQVKNISKSTTVYYRTWNDQGPSSSLAVLKDSAGQTYRPLPKGVAVTGQLLPRSLEPLEAVDDVLAMDADLPANLSYVDLELPAGAIGSKGKFPLRLVPSQWEKPAVARTSKSALESDAAGWIDLLTADDFKDWKRLPLSPLTQPGRRSPWKLDEAEGVLVVDGAQSKEMLQCGRGLGDGVLHVEWRLSKGTAGSEPGGAVSVRSGPGGQTVCSVPVGSLSDGYLLLHTGTTGKAESLCIAGSGPPRSLPAGEWNTCEITCQAGTAILWVNGAATSTWPKVVFAQRHLSLDVQGSALEFRNVKFKTLP